MKSINRKIPLFKVGDKYLRVSSYGGITTGTIMSIFDRTTFHTVGTEKYVYKTWYFTNDVGITIAINGDDGVIYKLESQV